MSDEMKFMDVHKVAAGYEIDFLELSYEGPRAMSIHLSDDSAREMALALYEHILADEAHVEMEVDISFCDPANPCDWCDSSCKFYRAPLRLVKDWDPGSTPTGSWTAPSDWYEHVKARYEEGDRDF